MGAVGLMGIAVDIFVVISTLVVFEYLFVVLLQYIHAYLYDRPSEEDDYTTNRWTDE